MVGRRKQMAGEKWSFNRVKNACLSKIPAFDRRGKNVVFETEIKGCQSNGHGAQDLCNGVCMAKGS